MSSEVHVALVGDYSPSITAHQAIPRALALAAENLDVPVSYTWLASDEISPATPLRSFQAVWCVPGSPYRNVEGVLHAIRYAREQGVPFLGTCGGFQHAVLEYARNVMGWRDAGHGETDTGDRLVITPLSCEMIEARADIDFLPGSIPARAYGTLRATEGYRCRYGINGRFLDALSSHDLKMVGFDLQGDVRAFELTGHPFFAGTLFQPERAALQDRLPPLVRALIAAAR